MPSIDTLPFVAKARTYVSNAVERRRRPGRFIQNDLTPFEVIHKRGLMSVRHYPALSEPMVTIEGKEIAVVGQHHRVPLVLIPPLGVYAWIFDLIGERSMVRYFLARGFDLYLVDWGVPDDDDTAVSLEHYVLDWMPEALQAIRGHSGQEDLSLLGYCMGGLLCLLYLATQDDARIRNLITIASPIDFHRNGPFGKVLSLVSKPALALNRRFNVTLTRFDEGAFHLPGPFLSVAFKMTNPMGSMMSYLDLVKNLGDRDYIVQHMSVGNWFKEMPAYPGATVQNVIEKFGIANLLAKGRLKLGEKSADFRQIKANLLAFAGENDKIVAVSAAQKLLEIVGSSDKGFRIVPGGHAGVFAGSQAAANTWRMSAEWLSSRSA